jgi:RimJ/RimL family protein N-acetyltransferase
VLLVDGPILLRPPTPADAVEWLAGEDDELARWFEFPRRSTLADATRAITEWGDSWRTGGTVRCWAICDAATGAICGGVELRALSSSDVNLSYWVAAPWRRRGLATLASSLALSYAASAMHASRAVLKILDGNTASLAVARRLGATPAGTTPSDTGGTMLVFHIALPLL